LIEREARDTPRKAGLRERIIYRDPVGADQELAIELERVRKRSDGGECANNRVLVARSNGQQAEL